MLIPCPVSHSQPVLHDEAADLYPILEQYKLHHSAELTAGTCFIICEPYLLAFKYINRYQLRF